MHELKGKKIPGIEDENDNAEYEFSEEVCVNGIYGLTIAIESSFKSAMIYYQRGCLYIMLQHYAEAIEDFTKSILLDPSEALFYIERAKAFIALNRFDLALEDRKIARQLVISDPRYLSLLIKFEKEIEKHLKKEVETASTFLRSDGLFHDSTIIPSKCVKRSADDHKRSRKTPLSFSVDASVIYEQDESDKISNFQSCFSLKGTKFVQMRPVTSKSFSVVGLSSGQTRKRKPF